MSRLHADLVVKALPPDAVPDPGIRPQVLVRDHSKYGTKIEGSRLDKGAAETDVASRIPCKITFGVRVDNDTKRRCPTTVRLAYQPIALYLPVDFDDSFDDIARDCAAAGVHLIRGIDAGCTHLLIPDPSNDGTGVPAPFGPQLARRFARGGVKPVTAKYLDAIRSRRDPAAPMPDPNSDAFAVPRDVVMTVLGGAEGGAERGAEGGAAADDDDATTDGEDAEDSGDDDAVVPRAGGCFGSGSDGISGVRGPGGAGWTSAGVTAGVSAAAAAKASAAEAARRAARDHRPGDGEDAGGGDEPPRFVADIDRDDAAPPIAPIDFHTEGKATVVFESIPSPRPRPDDARRRPETPGDSTRAGVPNFKRFRKQAAPGRVGRSPASVGDGRRRSAAPVVRYADEVYDALHQWEDGEVAAMHERLRREAALADDMFDREGDGRGAGSGRAKSKAKPRAKAARR